MESSEKKFTFQDDNFNGPLDLLVHLLRSGEIEVKNLWLVDILQDCQSQVSSKLDDFFSSTTDLTNIVANLLWLKSQLLLNHDIEKTEDDNSVVAQIDFLENLILYQQNQKITDFLDIQYNNEKQYIETSNVGFASRELEQALTTLGVADANAEKLAKLWQQALQRQQLRGQSYQVQISHIDLEQQKQLIINALNDDKIRYFTELLDMATSLAELIASFLAVLDLAKNQIIQLVFNDSEDCQLKIPQKNN